MNIGANWDSADKIEDYVKVASKSCHLADFITINVSSPNTMGLRELQTEKNLMEILKRFSDNSLLERANVPVLLKIAPDLNDNELRTIVRVCKKTNISGIIATNTTNARPKRPNKSFHDAGGMSGKPLFELSNIILAKVYYLSKGKIPLIGVGGVFSGQDAFIKLSLGASLIQVYTGLIYQGPFLVQDILDELNELILQNGHKNISEVIGIGNYEFLLNNTDRSILE